MRENVHHKPNISPPTTRVCGAAAPPQTPIDPPPTSPAAASNQRACCCPPARQTVASAAAAADDDDDGIDHGVGGCWPPSPTSLEISINRTITTTTLSNRGEASPTFSSSLRFACCSLLAAGRGTKRPATRMQMPLLEQSPALFGVRVAWFVSIGVSWVRESRRCGVLACPQKTGCCGRAVGARAPILIVTDALHALSTAAC
jgi:hypothetical protein